MHKSYWIIVGVLFALAAPFLMWVILGSGNGPEPDGEPRAKRIVSLALPVTETICLLGAEDRLVGIHDGDCPSRVSGRPRVGKSFGYTNVEAVVNLEPDVVYCWKGRGSALRRQGLVVREIDVRDLEGVVKLVKDIGDMVGKAGDAALIVAEMERRIRAVRERVAGAKHTPSVYFEGRSLGKSRGPGSLTHKFIELAGGRNIASGTNVPFPLLSVEHIIREDPEVILVEEYGASPEDIRARTGWGHLRAVKSGRIHVSMVFFTNYTSRCVEGLEAFARWFHPGLFEEEDGSGVR